MNKSRWLNITAVLISALITIASGFKGLPVNSENVVLVLGAILTAFGSIKTFFNYEKQIEKLSGTFHKYQMLSFDFLFYCNSTSIEHLEEDKLNDFKKKFLEIYSSHAKSVVEFRKEN
ncbi:hypothetical protein D3C74_412630 [compost metagenome]